MGEIECEIRGPWRDCILYEIPIMATSELFPRFGQADISFGGVLQVCGQGLDDGWAVW